MAILIIGFIIGVIGAISYMGGIDSFVDVFVSLLIGVLSTLIAALLVVILTVAIIPADEYIYSPVSETPIIALKDDQSVVGSHFLFSGITDSELRYYFATETDLGVKIKHVKAENAYVRYDSENPRIQSYRCTGFRHWYTFLYSVPLKSDNYVLYVPEGTIERVYEINLE